jgi:hypothetical protein
MCHLHLRKYEIAMSEFRGEVSDKFQTLLK